MFLSLALAVFLGTGCTTTTTVITPSCEVELSSVEPAVAAPGEVVTVTASPLTTDFDTTVLVGDVQATVTEVDRSSCEECETCRSTYECTACSDCSACDLTCEQTCVETLSFEVPQLPPGAASLVVANSHGVSPVHTLEILATDTGGGDDTGSSGGDDTGSSGGDDTGSSGGDDTGSSGGDDTGSSGGDDTGSSEASAAAPAAPGPGASLPPGPWREGTLASDATCATGPASAMSPR